MNCGWLRYRVRFCWLVFLMKKPTGTPAILRRATGLPWRNHLIDRHAHTPLPPPFYVIVHNTCPHHYGTFSSQIASNATAA
jgi:hypothetical protein